MSNSNGAGSDVIGDGNSVGSTLGKTTTDVVGFHGKKAAQVTVTAQSALNQLLALCHSKGLIAYTGTAATITMGSPLIVIDPFENDPTKGDGEVVIGVGVTGEASGLIRSDGLLDFIVNSDDTANYSKFRWWEGGKTTATSNQMLELDDGDLTVTGGLSAKSIAGSGSVTGSGGGASVGAGENIDVHDKTFIDITPAGSGQRYYNLTNKIDGQVIFINNGGANSCTIDGNETGAIYLNIGTPDRQVVARWDAALDRWIGVKGGYLGT